MNKRQTKIKEYIENYYLKNKYPPTIRDIQKALHIKSTSTVHTDVIALASEGLLEKHNAHILPIFTDEFIQKFTEACHE